MIEFVLGLFISNTVAFCSILYLFIAFIVAMKLEQKAKGTKWEKIVYWGAVVPFGLFDWAMNWTVFSALYREFPKDRDELVTDRLKRYLESGTVFQKLTAKVACRILHPIDKGHCEK